ncbi:hypothetical protein CFO_g956 [Ceratocystis platani]|uniref:Phosphoglycerate mutase n=1 Tax=Ceratocystis fimbriata f. sp. platani TaxID=88771 RepID=A0A0F8B769_CERFI|nr:hypothetical protein CFO_g956 [Ceratocystis platani]
MPHYKFQAVPDIFVDFAPRCAADPSFKVTTQPDLAIIDRSYPGDDEAAAKLQPWERLAAYVKRLNAGAEPGIKYKIVYLTRHGVGDHNAMIRKVGQKEWDTSKLVFEPLCAARNLPYRPTIKELLRERMTDHTCDRRSSKTYIAETFPEYAIEDGFTETDELWRADRWETLQAHLSRKQTVLEDIFSSDPSESISLAMHSMAVAAVGRAVQVDASPSYDEATEGLQGL